MRRILPALALLVLVACSGGNEPASPSPGTSGPGTPSPSTGESTPTLSTSAPPSPSPEPDLQLPGDAPTTIQDPDDLARIDAGDPTPLAPPGAQIAHSQILSTPDDPLDQIALAWERGETLGQSEWGFILWQRIDDAWRAVYAFTDAAEAEVLGIREPQSGDLTGDGIAELLTFENLGGSGGCGISRVISPSAGSATEIYRARTCDSVTSVAGDHLEVREPVFEPGDAHCCPSAFRTTTLEWDGERFVATEVVEEPAGATS